MSSNAMQPHVSIVFCVLPCYHALSFMQVQDVQDVHSRSCWLEHITCLMITW